MLTYMLTYASVDVCIDIYTCLYICWYIHILIYIHIRYLTSYMIYSYFDIHSFTFYILQDIVSFRLISSSMRAMINLCVDTCWDISRCIHMLIYIHILWLLYTAGSRVVWSLRVCAHWFISVLILVDIYVDVYIFWKTYILWLLLYTAGSRVVWSLRVRAPFFALLLTIARYVYECICTYTFLHKCT